MSSDMPQLVLEVAFTVGGPGVAALHLDDVALGLLDTGTLGADTWVDTTAETKLERAVVRQGSTRVESPLVRMDAGQGTFTLDDPDRRYDPTNLSGPYVSGGRTQVTPMRETRFRAVWEGVAYPLFRGYADQWLVEWIENTKTTVTLTSTDGFKVLAGRRRGAVAAVGAGESTSARVTRILDSAGWPAVDRLIGTGTTTVQATTLDGDPLAELQLTADTEIGELYVDGSGRVVFRGRMALLTETRSTVSQATFGVDPGVIDMPLSTDDAQLYNEIKITRVGGAEQLAEDGASQDEFLFSTFERSDLLMETDSAAADYAAWILALSREPESRFDKVVIYPRRNPAIWHDVLGRQIGDRITCFRQPPGGGDPIELDAYIRGIEHEIGVASWTTTFILQSAAKVGSFLTLDHASAGRLDYNALAF